MVVYNAALYREKDQLLGCVYRSCQKYIDQKKTPPLLLANNLWLGDIPSELSMLTLPERILVACYYPASLCCETISQKKGGRGWDVSMLNSGLQGNVSTYRMNTQGVTSMVEGTLLSPSPSILTSVIAVTIIGPKNTPDQYMPSLLTVN
ncbi:hypothetical protein JVU11DRAFT_4237 [Chiua virens]|nr:hypothetical protein JVU11DRAFT_4237 [Chiua virens]